jgi:hypothetical protein
MKKITLPVNEGPESNGPVEFRRFEDHDNLELGSLDRDAFTHLGGWYSAMAPDNYGFAYRIGIKEGVRDSEGDSATLMIMFFLPLARKGLKLDDIQLKNLESKAKTVLELSVMQASSGYDNLLGTLVSPPKYMVDDFQRDAPYAKIVSR